MSILDNPFKTGSCLLITFPFYTILLVREQNDFLKVA